MLKTIFITILSAIATLLCSPFASVGVVACWLNAWLTSWRLSRLGFEKMQGMDAVMAQYPEMINTFTFFLSGLPTIEQIHLTWQQMVDARDESGNLRYEKFSKNMEKHCGLWFWITAGKVHLLNHIRWHKGIAPSNEMEMKTVLADLQNAPLRTDIPQWQVTLVPLQGDFLTYGLHCCAIFRIHHAICDGYTFIKFLDSHSARKPIVYEPKNNLGNVKKPSNIYKLFMLAYAMSSLFRLWITGRITERNLLHGQQLNNKDYVTWATFDLNAVKAIKNAAGTSLTDVLLSCLSGAIRRYISSKNAAIPNSMSYMVPMGTYKPNTDYKLQNSILLLRLRLPMKLEDQGERLQATKRAFDELKRSPDVVVEQLAVQFLIPYLPKQLLDWFIVHTNAMTIGTSSLAGPNNQMQFLGQKILLPFGFQPHHGLMGISITFYGQMDKLHIGLVADSAIIKSQEDLEMIIAYITEELEELYKKVLPGPAPSIQIPTSLINMQQI